MKNRASATTLWLPLQNPKVAWGSATMLFLIYLATMSRDFSLYDSPELALVAYQLGLGHPPGQPLHTLLGWLFSHLPMVPPLFGLNMLSALFGALTVIPAIGLAEPLTRHFSGITSSGKTAILGLSIVLCGIHPMLWEPATRIEVYPVATFFALWAVAKLSNILEDGASSGNSFFAVGLGTGLCACANPLCAFFLAIAVAPSVITLLMRRQIPVSYFLMIAAGSAVGLLPYLYVPLVAFTSDAFVWGEPRDLDSLWFYFTGKEFARNLGVTFVEQIVHVAEWITWGAQRAYLPLPIIGIVGYILLAKGRVLSRWFVAIAFVVVLFFIASNAVWRLENPDYLGYLSFPLWLSAAGIGAVIVFLYEKAKRLHFLLFVVILISLVMCAPPALHARTRHLDRVTRYIAEGAMEESEPGSILVVAADHWVSPLFYLQFAEGKRTDLVILAIGLSSSNWYWQQIYRRHSELNRSTIHGPGGRWGRIQRFLDANQNRTIRFEDYGLARKFTRKTGQRLCLSGWFLDRGNSCKPARPGSAKSDQVLASSLQLLGSGSPCTDELIAHLSFNRGEALLRLGKPQAAVNAFLSGVPSASQPFKKKPVLHKRTFPQVIHLSIPSWHRIVALGDSGRNLFMVGKILLAIGDMKRGIHYLSAAAAVGLKEANDALSTIGARAIRAKQQ